MSNQPTSTVAYYNQVSPIGKPILDLLEIEYRESCIATLNHLEYYNDWNFNCLTGIKYLWRLGQKTKDCRDDILKSIEYFQWAMNDDLNILSIERMDCVNTAQLALYRLLNQMENDTI